jgi:thiol-disulfide isomerase/thioredoxin
VTSRRTFIFAGLLVAVAVGWDVAHYLRRIEGEATPGGSGEKLTLHLLRNPTAVPSFTFHDLDGRSISSDSLRDKVTIINFWATWCPPCRAEIPDLIALQNKYRDQLQIIGISQDDDEPAVVRRFVNEQRMNYPVVMSTPEIERIFTGVYALPTSFIIDRKAQIVQKHVGLLDASTTEGETRLLAGLSVNATIEYVEDETKALIRNAAQATKIPGVDLDSLPPAARTAVLAQLNATPCTCGCGLTLAACRINDSTCDVSLDLANAIVAAAAAQPSHRAEVRK